MHKIFIPYKAPHQASMYKLDGGSLERVSGNYVQP